MVAFDVWALSIGSRGEVAIQQAAPNSVVSTESWLAVALVLTLGHLTVYNVVRNYLSPSESPSDYPFSTDWRLYLGNAMRWILAMSAISVPWALLLSF